MHVPYPIVKAFKRLCYENLQDYFDCWPLGLDSNCFLVFILTYLNIPYVPCFHSIACEPRSAISANRYQMGKMVSYITEHDISPHARVTGAERALTVSHSETPSCALLCGLIQTTVSSLQAGFHTCHFCFPWHMATEAILVSFCALTATLLHCALLLSAPALISFS